MKSEQDVISIWYCENCGYYTLDFSLEKVYCRKCSYHMIKRRYIESAKKRGETN